MLTGLLVLSVFSFGSVIRDRIQLSENLVRLHVVADSDETADQEEKLAVRDAVLEYLEPKMESVTDADSARKTIQSLLPELERVSNQTLKTRNSGNRAVVTLQKEAFPTRVYDTFTLPSGVYDSLRITVGSGQGHNWWCVVFPELCIPETTEGFSKAAEAGGFSDSVIETVTDEPVEIRFFLLDLLGRIQNALFHR